MKKTAIHLGLAALSLSLCTLAPPAGASGEVVAWGSNTDGQTNVPAGLSGVVAVAGGFKHSLALKGDGTVVAWGDNFSGQTNVPAGLSGVVAIAAGGSHNLALKGDGTVVAWGSNGSGQTNVPAGLSGVVAISGGESHSLALKGDGTVVAWGKNSDGQTNVPAGLSGVVAVGGGWWHSLALKGDGTVVAWGWSGSGQTNVPAGLSGVVAIAGGWMHSLALKGDGTVVAWGDDYYGQTKMPTGLSGVAAIAAGETQSLALKGNGLVTAWGTNIYGEATVPAGLLDVAAVAAGWRHSLAAKRVPGLYPAYGSVFFSSSGTLTWDAVPGASQYALWLGSSPATLDLYAGLLGTNRSATVTLPTDGRRFYATVLAYVGGNWQQGKSYPYHAATPMKAQMLSPADGSTLTSGSTRFIWDTGTGATQYALWVGSMGVGSYNLYAGTETGLWRNVTLPSNGCALFVRLWSFINGVWQGTDYTYTAYTAPTARAQMLRPMKATTLTGSQATFIWDRGVGVTLCGLWVGSSLGSYDLYAGLELGQSQTLNNLPVDGRIVYARLFSLMVTGVWEWNDYAYWAFGP